VKYLITIIILLASIAGFGQKIILVRICNSGTSNTIYWQEAADTCKLLGSINIYAKENATAPYYKIDSNINSNIKIYSHLNANIPSIKDWEYKIEYKIICGFDTSIQFSDSAQIDNIKPDSSILDSVSVNPINNQVILGWSSNKTTDFAYYYLYNSDRVDPRLAENYADTFYVDSSPINPQSKSLTYDLTSSDSCDNRRDYGKYFHQTIWLRANIDTCLNQSQLNWSKYVGWETVKYFIFRKINSGIYELVHQTTDMSRTYVDKNLPINSRINYFVRAHGQNFSSSSNSSFTMQTGLASNPFNTQIETVTSNPNRTITIKARPNTASNYRELIIEKKSLNSTFEAIGVISLNTKTFEDANANDNSLNVYRLISKNVCGYYSDTTLQSGNIVLNIVKQKEEILLAWNKYFTWNNPIEKHIIYRATGNNISEAVSFMAINNGETDTAYIDKNLSDLATHCYFLEALELNTGVMSRSNIVCYSETGDIYYPNAIVLNGVNSNFTFIGKSIELEKSSIEIFDRWGNQIYSSINISKPWNGLDKNQNTVQQGVYFFIAKIKRNEEIIQLKGNINVLY
jgi:hypothetical protein